MNRNVRQLFLIPVLLICFLSDGFAAEQDELEGFLQDIQRVSDSVKSFQSLFIQEKHLALFTEPVLFSGRLAIIRPQKLRWEFLDPIPSVLILNGEIGIRCNDQAAPETVKLSTDPIMKSVADQLWLWLGGDYLQLAEQYTLSKKGESTLHIEPKDGQTAEYVESIAISFDPQSLQPAVVTITEPGGDVTIIRFSEGEVNQPVPEQLFTGCNLD